MRIFTFLNRCIYLRRIRRCNVKRWGISTSHGNSRMMCHGEPEAVLNLRAGNLSNEQRKAILDILADLLAVPKELLDAANVRNEHIRAMRDQYLVSGLQDRDRRTTGLEGRRRIVHLPNRRQPANHLCPMSSGHHRQRPTTLPLPPETCRRPHGLLVASAHSLGRATSRNVMSCAWTTASVEALEVMRHSAIGSA